MIQENANIFKEETKKNWKIELRIKLNKHYFKF